MVTVYVLQPQLYELEPTYKTNKHNFAHTLDSKYASYLKELYKPKQQDKYLDGDYTWPPRVTTKVFNLAMIKDDQDLKRRDDQSRIEHIQKICNGNLDHILIKKEPVKLEDVFKGFTNDEQRKVIIHGKAGCGKSTLSLHICQEWRKGTLFQDYRLVILVKFRDREVQKATDITGILPRKDNSMGHTAKEEISADNGKGVLLIFDGFDELPEDAPCRNVVMKILNGTELPESSIIITSRPSSLLVLQKVVGSLIEILGFTQNELRKYFAECLDNKTDVETLLHKIEENPRVAGSCSLPLNACILVHLFKEIKYLPSTEYGIFYELIHTCIVRDLMKRGKENVKVKSLDDLPPEVKEPFDIICKVAYEGVQNGMIIFDEEVVGSHLPTLGLLQCEQSFSLHTRESHSYNFVHLSIQEFLAAFYMATKLNEDDQVVQFETLFTQPRFYAVFRYFAAITKLKNAGIKEVVSQVAKKQFKTVAEDNSNDLMFGYTYQSELVTLFHCLFEAEDDDLCEGVVQQLNSKLDLRGTSLNPTDCLSLGYFLRYCKHCEISLQVCSIGDKGCKMLFSQKKGYPFRTLEYVIIFRTVLTYACACVNVLGGV